MPIYNVYIVGRACKEGSTRQEPHSETYEVEAPNETRARIRTEDYIKKTYKNNSLRISRLEEKTQQQPSP